MCGGRRLPPPETETRALANLVADELTVIASALQAAKAMLPPWEPVRSHLDAALASVQRIVFHSATVMKR